MLDINIPEKEMKLLKDSLSKVPGKAEKAAIRAMNQTAKFSKREQEKQIKKIYNVQKEIPKENIYTKKATKNKFYSESVTINKRCSLDRFKIKESPGRHLNGIHVYTQKGKKHVKNSKLFYGYYKSEPSRAGLFLRTGGKTAEGKQEIIKPYGPSLGDMVINPQVEINTTTATQDKLMKTLYKEMEKELD